MPTPVQFDFDGADLKADAEEPLPTSGSFLSELTISDTRRRILLAAAQVHAEQGYAEMQLPRVIDRAGVSDAEFTERFAGKLDCITALQKEAFDCLVKQLNTAWSARREWPHEVSASVEVGLRFAADRPQVASVLLPSSLLVEPALADGVWAVHDFLVRALHSGSSSYPAAHRPPSLTEQVLIGGVQALVWSRIRVGEGDQLPALRTAITQALLTPYLGSKTAASMARGEDGAPDART